MKPPTPTTPEPIMTPDPAQKAGDLAERLEAGSQRVLDYCFKKSNAPGLVTIPRDPNDIDALLSEAAAVLRHFQDLLHAAQEEVRAKDAEIARLRDEYAIYEDLYQRERGAFSIEQRRVATAEAQLQAANTREQGMREALEKVKWLASDWRSPVMAAWDSARASLLGGNRGSHPRDTMELGLSEIYEVADEALRPRDHKDPRS